MDKAGFEEILRDVEFDGWEFMVGEGPVSVKSGRRPCYLQVEFHALDSLSLEPMYFRGRKWPLSYHMTRSEVVQTSLMAALAAVEHEAREKFLYKGKAIFGPHHFVDDLLNVRQEYREENVT